MGGFWYDVHISMLQNILLNGHYFAFFGSEGGGKGEGYNGSVHYEYVIKRTGGSGADIRHPFRPHSPLNISERARPIMVLLYIKRTRVSSAIHVAQRHHTCTIR